MNKIVSINHVILNPKEYNGQRVVTFKDIDLVHGRAEGTARKRFADNKERFIEGVDYFVATQKSLENTEMSEKRTFEIPPRGITLLTETGYLMLVKSFTDDLAWAVQRELVNHYFKKETVEKPQSKREMVVDIPINPEYQAAFAEIQKLLNAVEVSVQHINCYRTEKDAMEYARVAEGIATRLMLRVSDLTRIRYKMIPQPY